MYRAVTAGIAVTVEPRYLKDRSSPVERRYAWSYTVTIENGGSEPVQLRARRWLITDELGQTSEVQGPGVVGQEPVLRPGGEFTYTSWVPLTTPSGIMRGTYQVQRSTGEMFDVEIPAFSLDSPEDMRRLN